MIPNSPIFTTTLTEKTIPTATHKLLIDKNRVDGYTDNINAMKQAIYLILNTERFAFPIYSWDYGIELQDLYGQHPDYVETVLPSRITEALIQDERITGVSNFNITRNKRKMLVTFSVTTIFGEVEAEREVSL